MTEADVDILDGAVRLERLDDALFHLMHDEQPAARCDDDQRHDDPEYPQRAPSRARCRHLKSLRSWAL
ncbi:hypothetical protein [Candidatus Burkholderia verschuerenii]|uniref:hypothetical protein n=1 Tax=Candidatus Burkholderia verschuerenii TaxID=242163 RepID=UPI001E3B95D8|nr:hypothetical protein [Candidatus Burkholderia verschuerenii]